jgi:hypothetical protein
MKQSVSPLVPKAREEYGLDAMLFGCDPYRILPLLMSRWRTLRSKRKYLNTDRLMSTLGLTKKKV